MRIITGDDNGLIKVSSVEDKKVIAKMGTQTREEAVECMCWAATGTAEGCEEGADESLEEQCNRIFSGRADGVVQLWDLQKQLQVSRMEPMSSAHELPRSIFFLNRKPGDAARLVTCCENGAVNIRTLDDALENSTAEADITVKGPVSRMRGAPSGLRLAYGGKENELQLFDIAAEKVEWTAKNVPHNFLDLRLPVWITDVQFLRNSDDRKIAVCTAYGQVRLYDVRAQRRPVMSVVVTETSEQIRLDDGTKLTCMALSHNETWAAVGDAQGELRKVDLKTGKVFGKFKHISGSIRGTAFHPSPSHNYVAAAGLDRHVRVYDAKKMSCISTIYAKQKLNCLLFDPQPPVTSTADKDEDEDWLGIQEAKAIKKKKLEEGEETGADVGAEAEAEPTPGKPLSRKGYNSVKKRKVVSSKKGSPATKKKGAAKKKK
mmetsp:Transcript_25625/g.37565  ORF Transcript_25625/g.37565 Transcript_25625/m.37565 type:complete len:432 (-) Transcript_25625:142-1437(-)